MRVPATPTAPSSLLTQWVALELVDAGAFQLAASAGAVTRDSRTTSFDILVIMLAAIGAITS